MGTIAGDELGGWDAAAADEVLGGSGGTVDVGGGSNTPGNGGGAGLDRFLVSVRLRPLNDKEISNRDPSEWDCRSDNTVIFKGTNLHDRSLYPGSYTFDKVFSADCNTRKVYEQGAKEVALSVVNGINSSIFAYGQTSSGKTYTMSGITEYAVADIYDYIEKHSEREFVLKFSAMEIYNEAVRDLLSLDPTALRLLDDPERGTIVEKLTEETLRDRDHLMELLSICQAQRQIGETSLNETSSRSHQILRLTIESSSRKYAGKESASTLAACVNFVDLAGSERASQAMSAGTRLKEGCHINRSLLTLGTVIRKLSKGRNGHIPYRDSKLTRILHPSLGGNARTAIICTMSPARSHMEQSRNTLLFASCAKEVATNAQVNVVMSDKALVKHLQKELARLENELRRPGSFCPDTLLKEKENQIYKMEKEIKMLVQQRDLAQSQLDGLLQSVKDDQTPRQLFCQFPAFHLSGGSIDMDSMSETSSIAGHDHHYTRKISKYQESANFGGIPNVNYPERPHMEDRISPRRSISSPTFVGLLIDGNEDITLDNNEEFEDLCKDVQCIEMDETSAVQSPTEKPDLPSLPGDAGYLKDEGVVLNDENKESRAVIPERDISSVKQKIEVDKKANFLEPYCEEVSSNYGDRGYCSSRRSVLARSRSCRANITYNAPSPWFLEEEQSETTPPGMSFKEYPGRPEGFQRKTMTLNYRAGSGTPSEVSRSSESIASVDPLRSSSAKGDYEENISCVSDFVSGMKEVAQIHHPDDIPGCKELKDEGNGDVAKSTKDMSVDAKVYPSESPTRWPYEFEKQRQRIIDLWHECNVSLVHRTYFFFLFKGDPEDSVYMEVELRRLSFLRNSFSQGGLSKHPLGDGFITSPASSMKALRREREKLCRSMQKRLPAAERDSLFRKWRIPLDSKQRRMQLARLLWSDTTDMEHIRESASVVAKLVGLQESGMAMKEMYGLSFGPEKMTRRTYSWT